MKDYQSLPFICMTFCSRIHVQVEQHQELQWRRYLFLRHDSVCCACHLLDAATNFSILKVTKGRSSNIFLPLDRSADPCLWQNFCRSNCFLDGQFCIQLPWEGAKQVFLQHLLIPLVTKYQCPRPPQCIAHLQSVDCVTTGDISKTHINSLTIFAYIYNKQKKTILVQAVTKYLTEMTRSLSGRQRSSQQWLWIIKITITGQNWPEAIR